MFISQKKEFKMSDRIICVWLLVFSLGTNVSFSTTITDCLCTNVTGVFRTKILICANNNANKTDSRYYSCYEEIFENGGSDNIDIKTGDCRGSTLDPRIPNAFKDLWFYDISDHGIESISPEDFRFNQLHSLEALHNKLTFIPAGLFIHAPHLSQIDFSFNNITAVETGAFSELTKLDWLRLDNNPIRYYDGKIFLPLHFRINAFSITWNNVEEFDVSNMNGIFDFGYSTQFSESFAFGKQIGATGYSTKFYAKNHFEKLKVFNSTGSAVNNVVKLIQIFGPSIEVLDVSLNSIGKLNGNIFDRFNNLQYLNLSGTNLASLDLDEIHNRKALKVLDVSYNDLSKINFAPSLGHFENVDTLNLIGNKLVDIDFVTQTNFPKLSTLGISQNLFTCNYLMDFLRQWPTLQLFNKHSSNEKYERGINCRDD